MEHRRRSNRKPIRGLAYLLSLSAFLGPFSQTIYTPILPEVTQTFQTTPFLVNLTVSLYTLCLALMQMVYGPLADTIGRRRVLLIGNLIYLAATLGCYTSGTIELLLLFRGIQAIGIAAGTVVAVTVIGDVYEGMKRGKAMATFQMMVALGPVLGPVAGGLVAEYIEFHAVFLVLFACGLVLTVLNMWLIPETKPAQLANNRFSVRDFGVIVTKPEGTLIAALGFVQYYALYNYLVFLPDVLTDRYGMSSSEKGIAFISISLFIVTGSYVGGKLTGRVQGAKVLTVSSLFAVIAIAAFIATMSVSLPLLLASNMLFGLCLGISFPVQTVLLTAVFAEKRATVVGMYNFIRYMGMTLGPIGGSLLLHLAGLPLAFGFAALLFLVCGWSGWRIWQNGKTNRQLNAMRE